MLTFCGKEMKKDDVVKSRKSSAKESEKSL